MRAKLGILGVASVVALAQAAAIRADDAKVAAKPDAKGDLVVHEWGTFTSMQGTDGETLDGLQHEEEGLPPFVYSRTKVRECPYRDRGYKGLEVPVTNVTRKMETPVTYFYSDSKEAQHVRVRVCFNQGLLTQWYPVSDLLGPPERPVEEGALDMKTVEKSFLEWDFNVLPKGEGLEDLRNVSETDPWRFARIPDSNVVKTVARTRPRIGPVEQEKFLFYRGLGRFPLPVHAQAHALGEGTIEISNEGFEKVEHVFAVEVHGDKAAWSYTKTDLAARHKNPGECVKRGFVPGNTTIDRPWSPKDRKPEITSVDEMVKGLSKELQAKLVLCGLYEKEAEAMTKTWERSYFHTEGLRLLYIVPDELTSRILPISIEPKPKELKRVLVARLECLTPEQEKTVAKALADRASSDAEAQKRGKAALEALGRFLEPNVRRAVAATSDETIKKSGEEVLAEIASQER